MANYDACDVFLQRGEWLRKLRALEAQDEAERALEAADASSSLLDKDSDTLNYESFLANQQYYDDLKHVNYRFIDFGYFRADEEGKAETQPLIIEQDRALGKGGMVWDAGVILADHVVQDQQMWPATRFNGNNNQHISSIVELGSGTGVTGLMVAKALQQKAHVSITDLPQLLPLMEKNVQRSNLSHNTDAFVLEWGGAVSGSYDVVLGADVIAGIYDPMLLAKTIFELCHANTCVYLATRDRLDEPVHRFLSAASKLFEHVERIAPNSRNKNPGVYILVLKGKRSIQ